MQNMPSHQEKSYSLGTVWGQREQQPIAEGRLYSLECATDFQPQTFLLHWDCGIPLWRRPWPLLFWASLLRKHMTLSTHLWATSMWMSVALFITSYPAQLYKQGKSFSHLWGRKSDVLLSTPNTLWFWDSLLAASFIHFTMCMQHLPSL